MNTTKKSLFEMEDGKKLVFTFILAQSGNGVGWFFVPMVCFILIAAYGYSWPELSRAESLRGAGAAGGHLSKPGN